MAFSIRFSCLLATVRAIAALILINFNILPDTTAHTTAFITGILALYPNIHARIREEADALWPGAHLNPVVRNSSAYKEDFHRLVRIFISLALSTVASNDAHTVSFR